MNLLLTARASREKSKNFLLPCLFLQAAFQNHGPDFGWSSYLKLSSHENPPQMCPAAWVLFDFRCSQFDNQDLPSYKASPFLPNPRLHIISFSYIICREANYFSFAFDFLVLTEPFFFVKTIFLTFHFRGGYLLKVNSQQM